MKSYYDVSRVAKLETRFDVVYTPDNPAELDDMPHIQARLWEIASGMLAFHARGRIARRVVLGTVHLHGDFDQNVAQMGVRVEWHEEGTV